MYTLQNLLLLPLLVLRALAQVSRISPLSINLFITITCGIFRYFFMRKNRIQKLPLSGLLRFALEEKFDKFVVSCDDKDAMALSCAVCRFSSKRLIVLLYVRASMPKKNG